MHMFFVCSFPRCLENGVVENVSFGVKCWLHFRPQNGPKTIPKLENQVGQVAQSQKSRWSGLFVLFVLLVSSGLVVWVVPRVCVQSWCRVTASHALVRGGPRRNDPPCPSRGAKALPLVPLCLLRLLCSVCFCLPLFVFVF